MEYFEAIIIQSIPRAKNKHVDRLVVVGMSFEVLEQMENNKIQPHIKLIFKPSIIDNDLNWQVFESDDQICRFLQQGVKFFVVNQDKLQHLYVDQIVQLKKNKLP